MIDRRQLLKLAVTSGALATLPLAGEVLAGSGVLKPQRLRPGDRVALVAPATVTYEQLEIDIAIETLQAMGLDVEPGKHILDRFGYLAGRDMDRAEDINRAFNNPEIRAVFTLRGGWGSSRLLPLLDYKAIKKNPKILLGYSDITSLLNGIHARTGLVTFHGPNVWSEWNEFSYRAMRSLLFDAEAVRYQNPSDPGNDLVAKSNRTQTITGGTASGQLIGGNLTLVAALAGTPYLPDFKGKILFLEDVGEAVYRMDRMLTQLSLGGKLQQLSGIVCGQFRGVEPEPGYGNFALMDILQQHCGPLGIPCYYGAMFGHIAKNSTLPIGIHARMNADTGTLELAEAAVS